MAEEAMESTERGRRKVRQGTVVSDRMDKTVIVAVERRTAHPLYGKMIMRTKKYHVHDEANDVHVGDVVRIEETRPLSRTKRWRVAEVIERAR
jgi:small subunit ribosomal protein S17